MSFNSCSLCNLILWVKGLIKSCVIILKYTYVVACIALDLKPFILHVFILFREVLQLTRSIESKMESPVSSYTIVHYAFCTTSLDSSFCWFEFYLGFCWNWTQGCGRLQCHILHLLFKNSKSILQVEIVLCRDWSYITMCGNIRSLKSEIYICRKFYMWLTQEIFIFGFCCHIWTSCNWFKFSWEFSLRPQKYPVDQPGC